jgi:hypothetical protein
LKMSILALVPRKAQASLGRSSLLNPGARNLPHPARDNAAFNGFASGDFD